MSPGETRASAPDPKGRLNLPLVAVIAIPAFAILASLGTVGLAILHGDRELPEEFHWEGFRLDRDFARFQRAVDFDVRAVLEVPEEGRTCRLALSIAGEPPDVVEARFVHATRPELDRKVSLVKVSLVRTGAAYQCECDPMAAGSWWIEITDDAATWGVRQHVVGSLARVTIEARADDGAHTNGTGQS